MREYFPYWQEILAAVFFVWLVLITVSFYLGRSAMKKELSRISALIDESGKNFKISRMELYNVISAIERRVAGIEDRELENSTEYSNVLAEVTALVQKGSDSAKHTFYFRVAEEVVKLQTNLNHMDPQIKGYRQLLKCSECLKDAMLAEGYEFIDLYGRPYVEGMNVSATFIQDDTLEPGQRIIKRVITPQINYNGQMIQTAKVVVSQNEDFSDDHEHQDEEPSETSAEEHETETAFDKPEQNLEEQDGNN